MQAAISGRSARIAAHGAETSGPITLVVMLMITPGHASRTACVISVQICGSHVGRCPSPAR